MSLQIGVRMSRQKSSSKSLQVALVLVGLSGAAMAQIRPTEIHDRISQASGVTNQVALTLDACSGAFDEDLILFLIRNRIPATLFATKKWLDKNPRGLAILKANLDLFDVEDHGENHIPAVIGTGRKVFGIAGFSVNADAGASLKRAQVLQRLRQVRAGDVIIAHMNKPAGDTAEGMSDGLMELLRRGLVFVRLDQVNLVDVK